MNKPGWLFLDKDEVEAFRRMVVLSDSEDTVDQLGFGLLTREVSDLLFPWCSTLTTRARYFLFSAAILNLSLERISVGVKSTASSDKLGGAQLRDHTRKLLKEVERLERILAVSLYAHYRGTGEFGIFGKKNLDQRSDRQVQTILGKPLLSKADRYPNRIYRGGLSELKLFSADSSSNSWAVQLAINSETPFSDDWAQGSVKARAEIERLERFWTDPKLASKRFPEACGLFKDFADASHFSGFRLYDDERILLQKRILTSSPYLKSLFSSPRELLQSSGELNLKMLSDKVDDKYSRILKAADQVNAITSPFQYMYSFLAKHQDAELKRKVAFPVKEMAAAHRNLSESGVFSHLGDVLAVTKIWINVLKRNDGCVNEDLVLHLKQRADQIVNDRRGKTPPHRLEKNKVEVKDPSDISEELEVSDSSFRLGRASLILRDVLGVKRAS